MGLVGGEIPQANQHRWILFPLRWGRAFPSDVCVITSRFTIISILLMLNLKKKSKNQKNSKEVGLA